MQSEAVRKATAELNRAERAAIEVQSDIRLHVVSDAWWTFVRATHEVWRALEIGAGRVGDSREWLDAKKREREKDDLLSYLAHARNSEEHGLKYSGGRRDPDLRIVADVVDRKNAAAEGTPEAIRASVELLFMAPRFSLRPVTERGTEYPPPRTHLSRPIDGEPAPGHVVHLTITYLQRMVSEARARAVAQSER